jgi:hypothetical protein
MRVCCCGPYARRMHARVAPGSAAVAVCILLLMYCSPLAGPNGSVPPPLGEGAFSELLLRLEGLAGPTGSLAAARLTAQEATQLLSPDVVKALALVTLGAEHSSTGDDSSTRELWCVEVAERALHAVKDCPAFSSAGAPGLDPVTQLCRKLLAAGYLQAKACKLARLCRELEAGAQDGAQTALKYVYYSWGATGFMLKCAWAGSDGQHMTALLQELMPALESSQVLEHLARAHVSTCAWAGQRDGLLWSAFATTAHALVSLTGRLPDGPHDRIFMQLVPPIGYLLPALSVGLLCAAEGSARHYGLPADVAASATAAAPMLHSCGLEPAVITLALQSFFSVGFVREQAVRVSRRWQVDMAVRAAQLAVRRLAPQGLTPGGPGSPSPNAELLRGWSRVSAVPHVLEILNHALLAAPPAVRSRDWWAAAAAESWRLAGALAARLDQSGIAVLAQQLGNITAVGLEELQPGDTGRAAPAVLPAAAPWLRPTPRHGLHSLPTASQVDSSVVVCQ